ncbi:MAG: cellulase family glycosylhydrolase [Oscillibacter sp.]|nr:cellulase family glycosylhydrolase [Oscillibacter sp.]
MPGNHWCAEPIREMETRGLIAGYADGTFRPANPVTAAQFVTILSRCARLEPVPGEGSHWAADVMRAALRAGWYDWDELPPSGERFDLPIPRFLAVKILMKALLPDARGEYLTESQKIKDFQLLDGRYYESVLAAYSGGVLLGDSSGCFRPNDSLSRAAACATIYRALQRASVVPTPGVETASQPEPARGGETVSQSEPARGGETVSQPEPARGVETASQPEPARGGETASQSEPARGGVAENGWLQVRGAQLCNEAGEAVVLRGMSSHGLQWYGQFTSAEAIGNTATWGANLFRVAMYTEEGGYLSTPHEMREKVIAAADAAIANDMYVILDWHILSDGNPMRHAEEAAVFFADMSERYRDCPAVLYEICNEPNGNATWERDIKPYAEKITGVIRSTRPAP